VKLGEIVRLESLNYVPEMRLPMAKRKSFYSVHPSVAMVQKWIAEMPEKTGRSLEDWLAILAKEGSPTENERRDWLKKEHEFNYHTASWVAEISVGKGEEMSDPDLYLQAAERYVADMFAGKKAALKPVYDALLQLGLGLAKDVKACPCTTIVPLYRNHVFAQIKPATNTRIDMGFALKDTKPRGQLIDTGGFAKKDRITHRIPITTMEEIGDEVKHWLKVAYEMDGK
jgi:Domain of unknown function (DUF5655)/Domain of unknown function (DUF4287)